MIKASNKCQLTVFKLDTRKTMCNSSLSVGLSRGGPVDSRYNPKSLTK